MAYERLKRGDGVSKAWDEYYCDTEADLVTITAEVSYIPIGSIAYIIHGGKLFMSDSDQAWVEQ